MGECIEGFLALGGFLGFCYILNEYILLPKERKMREQGYRKRYTYFGGPEYWEWDPTKKGVIPDETWKANGYRWSERYHRWYKPKKHK